MIQLELALWHGGWVSIIQIIAMRHCDNQTFMAKSRIPLWLMQNLGLSAGPTSSQHVGYTFSINIIVLGVLRSNGLTIISTSKRYCFLPQIGRSYEMICSNAKCNGNIHQGLGTCCSFQHNEQSVRFFGDFLICTTQSVHVKACGVMYLTQFASWLPTWLQDGVWMCLMVLTQAPIPQLLVHPVKPAEKHCKEQRVAIKHENALGA